MCSMIQNQNSYPMKDWHLENMKKTAVKYVTGLSENASSYQKRQYKKYGGKITNVQRSIDFDIKHGVSKDEVVTFLDKIRDDASYADIRDNEGNSLERLSLLKKHFVVTIDRVI
jgi:hypothetical protein